MKISDFFRTMCVVLIGIAVGLISYKKNKQRSVQKSVVQTNDIILKKFILKYKKPQRIEFQNFVMDPKNKYAKDIQNIKNMKIFLDENSNYYIELQMFTDENDPQAPLVAQCRFLDVQTKNLIQEQSINLF